MLMLVCPYCGGELSMDEIYRLFRCKFHLEDNNLGHIVGSPFVTVRHNDCFPFGVEYNKRTGKFKVKK